MIRFIKLTIVLFVTTFNLTAQHSVQSTVFNAKDNSVIEMANIRLLRGQDSSLVQGAQSDLKGNFMLNRVKPGKYILLVSTVGFHNYTRNIIVDKKDLILKSIMMNENIKLLGELVVNGTAAQMTVKGDTLEYNATAFKTQENAVVEDLLKRLPGAEISAEGKITINGQEIKKIRIDGKKFFGEDVEMTTKNLPAEMIDKIQVLEQKSDMAQLTGFEDGETERIINLTLKPNRKKGIFGTFTGGAGLDLEDEIRYDGNANINIMKGESQTSFVAGGNNTNTTRSSRGRFSGGTTGGITETQNFGFNNNTIVNPNFKIGGDAGYTHSDNYNETNTNKESYISGSTTNDSTFSKSGNNQHTANMRLEAEWKIDTLRTLIIQPEISYSNSNTFSTKDYNYYTNQQKRSSGNSFVTGNSNQISGGISVMYNKKSEQKKGRTYTTRVATSFSDNNSETYNMSNKYSLNDTTLLDKYINNVSNRFSYNLRFSVVEPLWNNKNMIEATVSFINNKNYSDRSQFNKDIDGEYTKKDSAYSNEYTNTFYSEVLELNYRYTEANYNLTLGFKGEPSQTNSYRLYDNGDIRDYKINVINYAPNARFQFNFAKKEFLRIDYRGNTEQPSINQTQPVKNNSNLMHETVGNPYLNPEFYQSLRFMYSKFNDKRFSSFSAWFMGSITKDALVTNSIYDESNKQYSQTVNAINSPYNFNANVMFNTPIIAKRLHFNTSTSGGYSMRYGYTARNMSNESIDIDNLALGDLSKTGRINATQQLALTFTHDFFEIGTRGILKYSNTENNLNTTPSTTYDWTGSGNIVLHLPYSINISSDLNYTNRTGYSSFDSEETIWNASIDKTLFKGKGVLAVKWNDILKQQLNIRQVIGDNYISYTKYNTLTSYFLVSFSYKLNSFGGRKSEKDMNKMERYGRPDGMDYHGGGRGEGSGGGERSGRPSQF